MCGVDGALWLVLDVWLYRHGARGGVGVWVGQVWGGMGRMAEMVDGVKLANAGGAAILVPFPLFWAAASASALYLASPSAGPR